MENLSVMTLLIETRIVICIYRNIYFYILIIKMTLIRVNKVLYTRNFYPLQFSANIFVLLRELVKSLDIKSKEG